METDLTAGELVAAIEGNLTKYFKWSPQAKKPAEKSGKSLWAFRDKRGRKWHGTVSVEPVRAKRRVFEVTIRIDRAMEKYRDTP